MSQKNYVVPAVKNRMVDPRAAGMLLMLVAALVRPAYAEPDASAQREQLRREAAQRVAAGHQAISNRARHDAQLRAVLAPYGDEDGDGVVNRDDWGLRTKRLEDGTFDVDEDGCAPIQRDSDDDGILDAVDQCPGTPPRGPYGEDTLIDEHGCEIWVWSNGRYTDEPATVIEVR